jgi:polyisoprenoid-binding protein YceI
VKNLILIGALVTLGAPAFAAVQSISAKGGDVEFLAIGKPSFIKIHGKGSAAAGKLTVEGEKVSGQFEFELNSLGTGIETRDNHMKNKYLEVGKFPKAALELKSATPIKGWSLKKPAVKDAEFNGVLTLHGVSKPVTGKFQVTDSGGVSVDFKVKLTDYDVAIPQFAGITVADEVEITVKIDKLDAT